MNAHVPEITWSVWQVPNLLSNQAVGDLSTRCHKGMGLEKVVCSTAAIIFAPWSGLICTPTSAQRLLPQSSLHTLACCSYSCSVFLKPVTSEAIRQVLYDDATRAWVVLWALLSRRWWALQGGRRWGLLDALADQTKALFCRRGWARTSFGAYGVCVCLCTHCIQRSTCKAVWANQETQQCLSHLRCCVRCNIIGFLCLQSICRQQNTEWRQTRTLVWDYTARLTDLLLAWRP